MTRRKRATRTWRKLSRVLSHYAEVNEANVNFYVTYVHFIQAMLQFYKLHNAVSIQHMFVV